ncbi:helix-turn-helix domain-containing protein [Vagococcus fluvialis]|uniref:helix-turn-helix domain-containing protein n=1 Tax=Vagococcus fluvialis TaxID=2738 RepID=UPI003B5A5A50
MKQSELYTELIKPDPQKVGYRIKQIRLSLNLSMSDFAKMVDDKSKSGTISNWETGKNLPNRQRLESIAQIGSITTNELLYGIGKDFINFIIYLSNEIRNYETNIGFNEKISIDNYDDRFMVISEIFNSLLEEYVSNFKRNNSKIDINQDTIYFNEYNKLVKLIYSEFVLMDGDTENLDSSITLVAQICDLLFGGVCHTNDGFISQALLELNSVMQSLDSYALDNDPTKINTSGDIDLKLYYSVIKIIEESMDRIEKLK